MTDAQKDMAGSLVAVAPSPGGSGTTLSVTASTGGRFPAVPFYASVTDRTASDPFAAGNWEVVRVTAMVGDDITAMTRNIAGARNIAVGDTIAQSWTAQDIAQYDSAIAANTSGVSAIQNLVNRYHSLIIIGHSYTNAPGPNPWQTGVVSRIQAVFGATDENTRDFGQGSQMLAGGPNPFSGDLFGAWETAAKFLTPDNSAMLIQPSETVRLGALQGIPSALFIIHGVNDLLQMVGSGSTSTQRASAAGIGKNASQNSLRMILSRHRSGALYGSIVDATGAIVWDSSISFAGIGWADVAGIQNTGAAHKSVSFSGRAFTITLPDDFEGGTIAIAMIGQLNEQTFLTSGINNSQTLIPINSSTGFPSSGTLAINVSDGVNSENILVTAGLGTSTWTVTRNADGAGAFPFSSGAVVSVCQTAHRVDWTSSDGATGVSGSTYLSGQGSAGRNTIVVKRFTGLTAADAGRHITGTLNKLIAADNSFALNFDSWWPEAGSQHVAPNAMVNLLSFPYGTCNFCPWAELLTYIQNFNTMMTNVCAEFTDGFSRVADVYTPWHARNGTIGCSMNATDTITGDIGTSTAIGSGTPGTLTDSSKSWVVNSLAGLTVRSGGKSMLVASNTATVITGATAWVGGAPSTGAYVVGVPFAAYDNGFVPIDGMTESFGANASGSNEHTRIFGVDGVAPNWILALKRGVDGTTKTTHASGDVLANFDWMHDDLHPNEIGHSVLATAAQTAIQAMPTLGTYQAAETQGLWERNFRKPELSIAPNWYWHLRGSYSNITISAGKQYWAPVTFDRDYIIIGIGAGAAAAGAGSGRFGLYLNDQSSQSYPGALLKEFGSVAAPGALNDNWGLGINQASATPIFFQVRPGKYWISVAIQGGTTQLRGIISPHYFVPIGIAPSVALNVFGFSRTSITGALADFAPASSPPETTNMPRFFLQLATPGH